MKTKKSASLLLSLASLVSLAGCASSTTYELSFYHGENKDANGDIIFNRNLYYTNSDQHGGPDPMVLDDRENTGYYYLYSTSSTMGVERSKDLFHWEGAANALIRNEKSKEVQKLLDKNIWAPEVIEENGTYYMFFSATPELTGDTAEKGVVKEGTPYIMYVATSNSPTGPFEIVNFTDSESCGTENVHHFNTTAGIPLTEDQIQSGDVAYTKEGDTYYLASFPHYYAKYALFSPDELSKVVLKNGTLVGMDDNARYYFTIDPSPYVDPNTGKKYLYFKLEAYGNNQNLIVGVEMENWLKPKWETATYLMSNYYYTIEDWKNGSTDLVTYEQTTTNEGPFMIYHDGKYYLSYSINDYGTSAYSVAMGVSDSPLGTYRKLREEEGGLLLCSSYTESKTVSGAGHHSFVERDGKLYIAYHRHRNFETGGGDRYTAIDEVKWINVKDIYGEDLTIPYVNGPTDSMQPLPEYISGYRNVAEEAKVTSDNAECAPEYTNDGLLSLLKTANEEFMAYIPETKIEKTTTFTYTFDEPKEVRSVLVYNSALESDVFDKIDRIELEVVDGKKISKKVMTDIPFDQEAYEDILDGEVQYVKSGTAAFAEFYDQKVKSVRVTIPVKEGQEYAGISEIRILGK